MAVGRAVAGAEPEGRLSPGWRTKSASTSAAGKEAGNRSTTTIMATLRQISGVDQSETVLFIG